MPEPPRRDPFDVREGVAGRGQPRVAIGEGEHTLTVINPRSKRIVPATP